MLAPAFADGVAVVLGPGACGWPSESSETAVADDTGSKVEGGVVVGGRLVTGGVAEGVVDGPGA